MKEEKKELPSFREQMKALVKEFFQSMEETKKDWKENAKKAKNSVTAVRENGLETFHVVSIGKDAYRIGIGLLSNCYLFVGEEEALLIDTGIGWSGLKSQVESITEKPLTVVSTHAVPDCVGGAGEFQEVFIGQEDRKLAKWNNKYALRKVLTRLTLGKYLLHLSHEDLVKESGHFKTLEETEFDLGGRTVKVLETPAHTAGSRSFKDSLTGFVVSGDVCTPVSLMIGPHAVPLKDYEASLKKVEKNTGNSRNYSSHFPRHLNNAHTYDLRQLVHKAVKKGNNPDEFLDVMHSEKYLRILVYFPARIHRNRFSERLKDALKY